MMERRRIYRRVLLVILAVSIAGLYWCIMYTLDHAIPDQLRVEEGREDQVEIGFLDKFIVYEKSVEATQASASGISSDDIHITSNVAEVSSAYTIDCKLFGLIDLKSIQVSVVEKQYLTPSGASIGIYMETDGILVIGTGTVTGTDGLNYEPAYNIVQSGDYITGVNEEEINSKKDMIEAVNQCGGSTVTLDVRRNGENIQLNVEPVMVSAEEYKVGIWVRDDTQGIGTLTFVDEELTFGALGHGITDVDTSILMELSEGKLYEAEILSIIKGEKGAPGELSGMIHYNADAVLGELTANTTAGIFGKLTEETEQLYGAESMEICLKQDIELGTATILSSVDGTIAEYEVEIQEINLNDSDANKGLVLKVTDEKLLSLTGGIVQGMSGSPIIQNGKIVGAVTHVFIQDSTSGFGIFIENMIMQEN